MAKQQCQKKRKTKHFRRPTIKITAAMKMHWTTLKQLRLNCNLIYVHDLIAHNSLACIFECLQEVDITFHSWNGSKNSLNELPFFPILFVCHCVSAGVDCIPMHYMQNVITFTTYPIPIGLINKINDRQISTNSIRLRIYFSVLHFLFYLSASSTGTPIFALKVTII